jgi:murein DD-endopeptidase MepM/ murein hydrolase activator NlpD
MRYAYDFIRTDERRGLHPHPAGAFRWFLIGGRTRNCYGWGQPVHAAFGGRVVQVVDGVSERRWLHPLRETWAALRNAIAFARARHRLDPARLAGNHVIVGSGDVYALYAHLVPGSVSVAEGEAVTAGQVVGLVGHSGNSTAPHLHFHLMDRADPFTAKGIPCAFAAYLAKSGGTWVPIHHGIPERLQRIRSVP